MNQSAASYIALAKEDLAVARKLLTDHPRSAAFHIQQGAEKLLKAVLSTEGLVFSANHQLGQLAGLLPADHVWRPDLMAFDNYTPYATSTRYPRPGGQMPRTPAKEALEAALRDIGSLVSEIADWCEHQDGKNTSKRP